MLIVKVAKTITPKYILLLIAFIVLPLSVGFLGSLVTSPGLVDWYPSLVKPFFTPPNWLFAPAWTLLFVLMGLSAFLVFVKKNRFDSGLILFLIQLVFNFGWSFLFFFLKNPFIAFLEITLLWLLILLTLISFWRVSKTAGWLFVPYLIWVSFASMLNLAIVLLN